MKIFLEALLFLLISTAACCEIQIVPPYINYQGRVTDATGEGLTTGQAEMQFSLYSKSSPEDITPVWGPQVFDGQTGTGHQERVSVVEGHFNAILGATDESGRTLACSFNDEERYLGVRIYGKQIEPLQQILATPFSLVSGNDLPVGSIVAWIPQGVDLGSLTQEGARALVPDGFVLCDGSQLGIPNLMGGLFLQGDDLATVKTGSKSGTSSHNHTFSGPTGYSLHPSSAEGGSVNARGRDHVHQFNITLSNESHIPKYLNVLFLIRVE